MPKARQFNFSIAEVSITVGRTTKISLIVNDRRVGITVPTELKAYFDNQFTRPNPTQLQRQKYATVMNLMVAAYRQGLRDAEAAVALRVVAAKDATPKDAATAKE